MNDFDKILQDMEELDNNIPEDKDCKKCPYSNDGVSQGMCSPCFDFCQGNGIGSIYLGEEIEKRWKEDDEWIAVMQTNGMKNPEIAEEFRKRIAKRREAKLPPPGNFEAILSAMREECFHMTDEEASVVVDEFIEKYPEILDHQTRDWFIKNS